VATSDGVTMSNGIDVGSLSPSQEIVIKLDAKVLNESNFSIGTTTLINIAGVRGSNINPATAQMSIFVTRGQVAGTSISKVSNKVATGTTDSLAISLVLALLSAYIYMGYSKTGTFKQNEALAVI